jgi:hypothetical protein
MSKLLLCLGPARTGTTWLWQNLKQTHNTHPLKETFIWCEKPYEEFPLTYKGKPINVTKQEYINTVKESNKPYMDFSLGWYQAYRNTSFIKELNETCDLSIYIIIRDPYEAWISMINHTSWYLHTKTFTGNVFDEEAHLFNSEKGIKLLERKQAQWERRKRKDISSLIYTQYNYADIIPAWEELGLNVVLIDYNAIKNKDTNYLNNKFNVDIDWDYTTTYSTERNVLIQDNTVNADVKEWIYNYYQNDYSYLDTINDKYK